MVQLPLPLRLVLKLLCFLDVVLRKHKEHFNFISLYMLLLAHTHFIFFNCKKNKSLWRSH